MVTLLELLHHTDIIVPSNHLLGEVIGFLEPSVPVQVHQISYLIVIDRGFREGY